MLRPCPACRHPTAVEGWDAKRTVCWIQCDDVDCYVRGPVARARHAYLTDDDFEYAAKAWDAMPRAEPT